MFYTVSYQGRILHGILILGGRAIFPNGDEVPSDRVQIIEPGYPWQDKEDYE